MKQFEINYLDPEKPRLDKEGILREIDTLRKLNHQNILKIEDLVLVNNAPVIVMQLCDGSLRDYIDQNKG
jgi:serine/threonine protein kinase